MRANTVTTGAIDGSCLTRASGLRIALMPIDGDRSFIPPMLLSAWPTGRWLGESHSSHCCTEGAGSKKHWVVQRLEMQRLTSCSTAGTTAELMLNAQNVRQFYMHISPTTRSRGLAEYV